MCVCMQTLFYSYRCVWLQSLNFVVFFEPSFLMHILSVGCSAIVSHLFIFSIHAFMRMCVCARTRERERERQTYRQEAGLAYITSCVVLSSLFYVKSIIGIPAIMWLHINFRSVESANSWDNVIKKRGSVYSWSTYYPDSIFLLFHIPYCPWCSFTANRDRLLEIKLKQR
jgi:hypothetical protein